MELPALLAGSGMKRASSDEVGAGNRPDFCCAETAIGGQALCLPSSKEVRSISFPPTAKTSYPLSPFSSPHKGLHPLWGPRKGRIFSVFSKPFFSNQILLAYVVGIGSLLC